MLLVVSLLASALMVQPASAAHRNTTACNRLKMESVDVDSLNKVATEKSEWHHLMRQVLDENLADEVFRMQPSEPGIMMDVRRYMGPRGPFCKQTSATFGHGDEEKRACLLDVRNMDSGASRQCVVYSIGSNNQWTFEEGIYGKYNMCGCIPFMSANHFFVLCSFVQTEQTARSRLLIALWTE